MTSVLLTGYAVGSLLAAGLAMAMYLSGAALRQIFGYLLGGFDRASWELLAGAAPIISSAAPDRWAGPGRSTGCCSARRRRTTSASTSNGSGGSSSAWRRS